jgi:hypothetical protein
MGCLASALAGLGLFISRKFAARTMRTMVASRRRPPRWVRRVRRWWRETPRLEVAKTVIVLGLALIVVATLILLGAAGHL